MQEQKETWCERCREHTIFDDSDAWYEVDYGEYVISRCPVCKGMYYHAWDDLSLVNRPMRGETHSRWELLLGSFKRRIRREVIATVYLIFG